MNIAIYIIITLFVAFVVYLMITLKKLKDSPSLAESKNIIHLDEKNFQQTTKNSLALIDFWAEWCMPCKMMTPILNEVANEVNGNVKICKLNVDQQQSLASRFSVMSIPTLIILKNGKEAKRFVGVQQKDFLLNQISKLKN
jgi:thioredoxin 1